MYSLNQTVRSSVLAAALIVASYPATAQVNPTGAPAEVLSAYDVKAGTVQDLSLPFSSNQPFQVDVILDGATRTLNLHPEDIRAADYKLLVDNGTQLIEMPRSPSVTFQGSVAGFPGSVVAMTLVNGQLTGALDLQDETWAIQPVNQQFPRVDAATHLIYRQIDSIDKGGRCGVSDQSQGKLIQGAPLAASVAIKEAEIAIDCDNSFYTSSRFGGGSVSQSEAAANGIINRCTTIYKRDVEVQFKVTTIIVRTSSVYSGSISTRLGQFQSRWRSNHGSVRRDLAHLLSGTSGSGVIGVAYLGVVCSNSSGYGASAVGFSGSLTSQTGLVSHEAGHQFNGPHCSGGSCYIMCSSLGGCGRSITRFGTSSISRIKSYAQSRSCLSNVSTSAPTLTGITPNSTTSYQPQGIQLTGTDLDAVVEVKIGASTVVTNFSQTATTLNFAMPSPYEIGSHIVTVSNSVGTSNPVSLQITGNHPSVLETPTVHFVGGSEDYIAHTDKNWTALYFLSTEPGPSALPGIVTWDIGNNFNSGPYQIVGLVADTKGEAKLNITMPSGLGAGTFLYWQLVTYDPSSLSLPLETSNFGSVVIF